MNLMQDVRLAARVLVRARGVTLAAVAALALGIAATNTVFTIVNAVLFRDLPFADSSRIVAVRSRVTQGFRQLSFPDLQDWRARSRTLDGLAGVSPLTMNVSEDDRAPERFAGALVEAPTFSLIGHAPVLGRDFTPDDDRPGAQPVVILGHDAWRTRYRSDPAVIGRTIRVNGAPSVVIGVMAEGFKFPFNAEVWQPLATTARATLEQRDARRFLGIGRLKPGSTVEQANADVNLIAAALAREYPATNADIQASVQPYRELALGGPIRTVLFSLLGAVVFVLLIACANVANLLLARAADRTREVSVRLAVGASRWQIVRQLLIESVLLASAAGVAGLALSLLGVRLFRQAVEGTGPPYWLQFEMDVRAFLVFAAVCLTTALVFGLAPALHTSNLNVNETLNESGRGGGGTIRARRWAGVLVVAQLALALVLLTGAGLMMRTFLAQVQQDVGVETAGLLRMRFDLTEQNYPSRERRTVFFQQLDERLASTPGLTAALASTSPQGGGGVRDITIEGRPEPPGAPRLSVTFMVVGGRYFNTLGVPMLRGRALTAADRGDVDTPAVVNQRFVAQHFPAEDPIGRRVRIWSPPGQLAGAEWAAGRPPEWATIVGVAPNIRQRDQNDQQLDAFDPILYVPFASNPQTFTTVLVRSTADAGVASAQLREVIRTLDPDLPLFDVETVDQALAENRWPIRVFGSMFAIFAVVAMVLAIVGLYGVTAYSVSQRTREIGVRMALGAQAQQVWWLVTRRASIQIAIGLVIGLAGAIAAGQMLQGSLIRVSATDPATLAVVPALLVLVGLGASLVPARRAMQLDPVAALRHE